MVQDSSVAMRPRGDVFTIAGALIVTGITILIARLVRASFVDIHISSLRKKIAEAPGSTGISRLRDADLDTYGHLTASRP